MVRLSKKSARVLVSIGIGIASASVALVRAARITWHPSDFGQTWFGALALRHGANPYHLIGPGLIYDWPWPMYYPATGMVAMLPASFLPENIATVMFVGVSCALLAYGVTAQGWHRLPLFLSWPLVIAVIAGQWSPIVAAAYCLPALGWLLAAKPNLGLAVVVASDSRRLAIIAALGAIALTIISLIFQPHWPADWIGNVRSQTHIRPPVTRIGGVFILLAALRWRRPEARLLLAMACVPQTSSWYDAVPLFLIPATLRESLLLSSISTLGFFLPPYLMTAANEAEYNAQMGAMMVAVCYLPATLLVLRRPNSGNLPGWAQLLSGLHRPWKRKQPQKPRDARHASGHEGFLRKFHHDDVTYT